MSEVFISYARSREAEAERIAEALRSLGYSVWRDDEIPAHRAFADVIEERLREARAVLVVWSEEATESEWVQSEADRARLDHKLVQVTIDGARPPMPFDRIQCVDLVGWRDGAASPSWRKVVASVGELVGRPPAAPEPPIAQAPAQKAPPRTRWPLVAGAATAALLLALGGVFLVNRFLPFGAKDPPFGTPVVEVRAFEVVGGDRALAPFAARATDSIAAFLGDSDVRVVSGALGAGKAQLAFEGAVSAAGGKTRLRLTLEDKRTGTTLWSRDFAEPDARADALIDEAKGAAIEVTNLVRGSYGRAGLTTDSETLLHGMRGGEDAILPTPEAANDAIHEYELALARTPDSGVLRAAHANGLVIAAGGAPTSARAEMLRRAKAEAERVIRDHPAWSGGAYLALLQVAQLEAPRDLVGARRRLDAALKAASEDPFLENYACLFLQRVGRYSDSLYHCRRGSALRPHTAPILNNYAYALDEAGESQQAEALLDEAARLYPNYPDAPLYQFMREAFVGSPDKALARLHDPGWVPPYTPDEIAALELLQKARKSGSASDGDAAMAAMQRSQAHRRQSDLRVFFPMALGRFDDAYAGPDIGDFLDHEWMMSIVGAPLRRDPRFWPIAARSGLVRYWLTTDKWPDFCADPSYPLDCKAEARKVANVPIR